MKYPKVSVIMPSLDVAPYIRECMESVTNQTLKDIEIICVDAGSTDGTLEVLEEYTAKDSRITIIRSDKKSYGYQVNLGIDTAKGEYIGIVETDDYIETDMYRALSIVADKYQLDILKADFEMFWGEGTTRIFEHHAIAFKPEYYNTLLDPFTDNDIFRGNTVPWPGLYKTSFLKEKRVRLNESPGASFQDNGLWWQTMTQAHSVMFVNRSFYRLRRDNPNSSVKSKSKIYAMCEEYDFNRDFLRKHPELEARFTPLLAFFRMRNYNYTLSRIAPEFRLEFLHRYAEDFRKIDAAGELDRALYTDTQWEKIHEIMECPEYIYYLDYYKGGYVKAENAKQKSRADQLQHELDSVHNSVSYRIGRAVTWLPRKVRGGVRCVRDHGVGYTVRRTLYHIGLWEDEEAPKGPENRPKQVKHAERILHKKKGK